MKGKRPLAMLLCGLMLLPPVMGRAAENDIASASSGAVQRAPIVLGKLSTAATQSGQTQTYTPPEDTGVLPPQMGWSTWNFFRQNIDQDKIMDVANTMVETGLVDAGYTYLNLDDCWQSNMRDEQGRMMFDLDNFPDGPDFINQLHEMGLKVGLYSSSGELTCEDLTASYGHETIDARTFAEWGVDYLKYDYCHVVDLAADQGWETLMTAPEVDYISVMPKDAPDADAKVVFQAEEAALTGNATVADNGSCQGGKYVTGLNANGGTVTFENVEVEQSGSYILTIGFRKTRSEKGKFAEIVVNGSDKYETNIARTSGWSATGRQQLVVELNEGSNTIMIHNPIDSQKADSIRRYSRMGNALKEATAAVAEENGTQERPVFFSVCEHGRTQPWTWAGDFANSWRTSGDIAANWGSVVGCYESAVSHWAEQKPGAYNDPDMMQVGNGNLTETENRAHFTLWCMLSAPLILGNDVREFLNEDGSIDYEACNGAYEIVTNQDLIAINQDLPLLQCKRISTANGIDILVKPLLNQETGAPEVAVCFFNKNGADGATAQVDLTQLSSEDDRVELPESDVYMAHELWEDTETLVGNVLDSGSIPAHGVKVYRVSQGEMGSVDQMATVNVDALSVYPAESVGEVTVTVTNMGREDLNSGKLHLTAADGVTVLELESEEFNGLATGETAQATFHIQLPQMKTTDTQAYVDSYTLSARAEFTYETAQEPTEKTSDVSIQVSEPVVKQGGEAVKLGDANWMSSSTGWAGHPTQRNQSINGNPIRIAGTTYESGIGTHASSDTILYVGGTPCTFAATVGIDDEVEGFEPQWSPSVTFRVLADGVEVFATEEMVFGESQEISLKLENCQVLTLRADMGEANSSDHVGWGNATLTPDAELPTYRVNLTQTDHGSIAASPAGEVEEGNSVTFTFTPDEGYYLTKAIVNGQSVLDQVKVDETSGVGTYTVEDVRTDLVVAAGFTKEGEKPAIQAVESVEPMTVYGLPGEALALPETLTVTLEDGTTRQAAVTWTCPNYQPWTDGVYTFVGTLGEGEDFSNPQQVTATAEVTVALPSDNIAPNATASCPDGVAAGGKQVSWVNDQVYDDQGRPAADGVFGFQKPLPDNAWFDLTWDTSVTLDRVVLNTYFGSGQGPTAFTVFVQYQGSEEWTQVAERSGITYVDKDREQQPTEIVFDTPLDNVCAMRVQVTESNSAWSITGVVTEFEAYGRVTHPVVFHTNNGEEAQRLSVLDGSYAQLPQPTYEDHKFLGWFTDEAGTAAYEPGPVTGALELYAKWESTHTHTGTLVQGTAPTCTQPGTKDYYTCTCGKCFEDEACTKLIDDVETWKVIPATGHHFEDGVCTVCGEKDPDYMVSNKTLLKKTYDYALTLSTDGVTDAAKAAFETALDAAKAVLDDESATQDEINTAWDNLLEGIWGLGLTQGDKTMLNLVIDRAQAMLLEEDKYVADHWQLLVDALDEAQKVAADGNSMQEDVDKATQTLLDAILAQRFKADKSILEDLTTKAEGMDLSGYTAESVEVFRAALAQAQAVLADETLSEEDQAEVDAAVEQLTAAMDGLTAQGESQPSEKPESTDQPQATQKPEQVPQTGDGSAIALWAALLAGCGAGVGALAVMDTRRKEQ